MAVARLRALCAGLLLVACGGAPPPAPADVARPGPTPAPLVFGAAPPGEFVSKRFGLHVRLPDGRAWRIDDHRGENLVAVHPAAGTELRAARYNPNALVGTAPTRAVCWEAAVARGVFLAVTRSESVVENEERYDGTTDSQVTVSVGQRGEVGYVRYVAGRRSGCVALGIESKRLAGDSDETLAERLALLRERVIAGLADETRGTQEVPRGARPR